MLGPKTPTAAKELSSHYPGGEEPSRLTPKLPVIVLHPRKGPTELGRKEGREILLHQRSDYANMTLKVPTTNTIFWKPKFPSFSSPLRFIQ